MNIIELKQKRIELIGYKTGLQTRLTAIKNRIRGRRLPADEYKKLCDEQTGIVRQVNQLEASLSEVNSEIQSEWANKSRIIPINRTVVEQLVALRKHYEQFAADHTRVGSMRRMASEFIIELNSVIKFAIGEARQAEEEGRAAKSAVN